MHGPVRGETADPADSARTIRALTKELLLLSSH